jgi:hypothetical protein
LGVASAEHWYFLSCLQWLSQSIRCRPGTIRASQDIARLILTACQSLKIRSFVDTSEPKTPPPAPMWWLTTGCIAAIVASVLLVFGTSPVRDQASLQRVSGRLNDSVTYCARLGTCWITLCLRTGAGPKCVIASDSQLPLSDAKRLQTGDALEALGWPVSDHDTNLRVWDLRRSETVLVSYEQSAADARANRQRCLVLGVLCSALSLFGLGKALVHWFRWHSWEP